MIVVVGKVGNFVGRVIIGLGERISMLTGVLMQA
jgi:hypothetical protein